VEFVDPGRSRAEWHILAPSCGPRLMLFRTKTATLAAQLSGSH
jgi:hypothetical protein